MTYEIGTDGISSLVVGYDGSDASRDALAFAAGMARRNHARLTIVYVPPASALTLAEATPMGAPAFLVEQEMMDSFVADVSSLIHDYAVNAELVMCGGNPAQVIEAVAEERKADAVVVGQTHIVGRRTGGSVPSRLLREAQRPVMVIP